MTKSFTVKRESSRESPDRRRSRKRRTLPFEESFHIPEELLENIFLRLPVKSLLKFRCVSKSWLSLISCPQFIKTHTGVSLENSKLSGHRVVLSCGPQSGLEQCSVHSFLRGEPLADAVNIDYPVKCTPNRAWVAGSCNGLICTFVDVKDIILWNPSTRKSKKLPSIGTTYHSVVAYGFGFDEYEDDYKVAALFRLFENRSCKFVMMVYGLRDDSWKRVGDLEESSIPLSNSIKFASGKLHWLSSPGTSTGFRREIISLDPESGVCGRFDQPDYGGSDIALSLGVLGGCLCILSYEIGTLVDVWVLKEYGVKGSWTKLFRFPCVDCPGRFVFLKPLYLLPSGEILLVFGTSFVLCNPADGTFRVLEGKYCDKLEIYVETLVSPAVI